MGSKPFDTLMVFLKEFLRKKNSFFLQTIWTQIRPDLMPRLILIQNVLHSDGVPESCFEMVDFSSKQVWTQIRPDIMSDEDRNCLTRMVFLMEY